MTTSQWLRNVAHDDNMNARMSRFGLTPNPGRGPKKLTQSIELHNPQSCPDDEVRILPLSVPVSHAPFTFRRSRINARLERVCHPITKMRSVWISVWLLALAAVTQADYWLGTVNHQGSSPFNPDQSYEVFRNVRDFGAKGDGIADDTAAINAAIAAGTRCGLGCDSSTTTPGLVYFPPGTYVVSSPLLQYYYTFMVGDANDIPVLKAAPSFSGIAVIDADVYAPGGVNWFTNQNNFFRQIKNFRIDLTSAPSSTGIHWQVSQATNLQNIFFDMTPGGAQQGIFMENGSGGFLANLTFTGGKIGMVVGNQQFTMRDLVFNNCDTAVKQIWNWGFVYKGLRINGGSVGIDMTSLSSPGNPGSQLVSSIIILDSIMNNVGTGILTAFSATSGPGVSGSLRVDNVNFSNTPVAVGSPSGSAILVGNQLVDAWAQGSVYSQGVLSRVQGFLKPLNKSVELLSGTAFLERNKPLYADVTANNILSSKSYGAKGDGVTDDTAAIQALFNLAGPSNVVFFDHGVYLVTDTIDVPAGTRMTGEIFPIIMASGPKFTNIQSPIPVFRVGQVGDVGILEMSDLIFEASGPLPGAILIEWNIKASSPGVAGLWDVHARIGGTAGSQLQQDKCSKGASDPATCSGPFMLFHSTKTSGFYMENCWWWTSDHELDMAGHNQISVFTGRGMLVESQEPVWLYGTASEHNQFYNYQFSGAANVFAAMFQVETPYYQGTPNALVPFPVNSQYNDPTFSDCSPSDLACARTWGLRIVNSKNIIAYGAGLYSFYDNYTQSCYATQSCQTHIVSIESSSVTLMGVNTIGTKNMITVDGVPVVSASSLTSMMGNNGIMLLSTLEFFDSNSSQPWIIPGATTTTTTIPVSKTTSATASATPSKTVPWNYNPDGSYWSLACDWTASSFGNATVPGYLCGSTCEITAGCTRFSWTPTSGDSGVCLLFGGPFQQGEAIISNKQGIVCGGLPPKFWPTFSSTGMTITTTTTTTITTTTTTTTSPIIIKTTSTAAPTIQWNYNPDGSFWQLSCDWTAASFGNTTVPGYLCGSTCESTTGCTRFSWTPTSGDNGVCLFFGGPFQQGEAVASSKQGIVCGGLPPKLWPTFTSTTSSSTSVTLPSSVLTSSASTSMLSKSTATSSSSPATTASDMSTSHSSTSSATVSLASSASSTFTVSSAASSTVSMSTSVTSYIMSSTAGTTTSASPSAPTGVLSVYLIGIQRGIAKVTGDVQDGCINSAIIVPTIANITFGSPSGVDCGNPALQPRLSRYFDFEQTRVNLGFVNASIFEIEIQSLQKGKRRDLSNDPMSWRLFYAIGLNASSSTTTSRIASTVTSATTSPTTSAIASTVITASSSIATSLTSSSMTSASSSIAASATVSLVTTASSSIAASATASPATTASSPSSTTSTTTASTGTGMATSGVSSSVGRGSITSSAIVDSASPSIAPPSTSFMASSSIAVVSYVPPPQTTSGALPKPTNLYKSGTAKMTGTLATIFVFLRYMF